MSRLSLRPGLLRMKQSLVDFLRAVERVELWLAKLCLLITMVIVGLQVLLRYGLNRPLTWPEELAGFLLVWLTFLVADLLVKRKGHVEVEYFADKLSPRAQAIVGFVVNLYIIVFLVFLVVTSVRVASAQFDHGVGAALRIPKAYYTLAATVSGVSMLLSFLLMQWEALERLRGAPERSAGQ